MNAQLNSINFQQFVNNNKGKLISFLHNDKKVSKVVVDIQGEYFTCKTNESDAKIDGFYYFSDCKMIDEDHPLISVIEQYIVSVLHLSIGQSCIFKYNHYLVDRSMVNGTCLITSQPVGFHADSVKEVWAIVDGKYTKVYPQEIKNEISLIEKILSSNKDVTIDLSSNKSFLNFNYQSIIDGVICATSNGVTTGIMTKHIKRILSKDGKELYVNNKDDKKEDTLSDKVNQMVNDNNDKDKNQYKLIQEHHDSLLQLKDILIMYAPKNVNEFMDITNTIKNSEFSKEKLQNFIDSWENVKKEFNPIIQTFRYNSSIQALIKRYTELAMLLAPLRKEETKDFLKKIDNTMTLSGKQEYNRLFKNDKTESLQINIEYRGKPKTVEVMSEYNHSNGKEYVMVKDLTDNGKTKTLFKEYIKYL